MFGLTRGELMDALAPLQAQLTTLAGQLADMRVQVAELDPVALEQLRNQVLNSIRSLRRLGASQSDDPPAPPPDPSQLDIQPTWAKGRRA